MIDVTYPFENIMLWYKIHMKVIWCKILKQNKKNEKRHIDKTKRIMAELNPSVYGWENTKYNK